MKIIFDFFQLEISVHFDFFIDFIALFAFRA